MIVNQTDTGWSVIYQRAHALLAAQIASYWREDARPERWVETLAAIAQHDDGGREWVGANHLQESGAPLDFRLSEVSLDQPSEAVENAQYHGRWVALLISMHTSNLYSAFRDQGEEFAHFLDEQAENQQHWRRDLKVSKKEADAAYAIMHFGDQLSLILCCQELPTNERELEISKDADGTIYYVAQKTQGGADPRAGDGETMVTVTPWPFSVREFVVRCETTYLDQLSFKDDQELIQAMKNGRISALTWRFQQ